MQHHIKIRRANESDSAAIIQLFAQLGYTCTPSKLQQDIAKQSAEQQLLLAVQDDIVLGLIGFHIICPFHDPYKWGFISALVVKETSRGQGVGGQLLQAVEAQARTEGCGRIELSSNPARTKAHAFYEQHGYQEKPKRFVKLLC